MFTCAYLFFIANLSPSLDAVLDVKETERILIGIRGSTGSGKSTLINALIRMKDLLPTTCSKACTAVPVEVAYNDTNDDDTLFRAEIHFVSHDEWKRELDMVFRELQTYSADEDEAEVEDLDLKTRITEALTKLNYVYPHIKSINDLSETSVSELLDDFEVKKVLNHTKIIHRPSQKQFSAAIAIYVATSESDRKKFVYWPLVKCVKVFVKAPFLKYGIVLVDLPGGVDSNVARGAIAERYQKHLAVTCIVGDIKRGIDDQNASYNSNNLFKVSNY